MAENGSELRKIAWSQALPFVRLFQTTRLALGFNRMVLALACVVCIYAGGRILDWIWSDGGGVTAMPRESGLLTEIQVYTRMGHAEFDEWLRDAREAREQRAVMALLQANVADRESDARQRLATSTLRDLLIDDACEQELTALRLVVDQQLEAGLAAADQDQALSSEEREERRWKLIGAADTVRKLLAGQLRRGPGSATHGAEAIETLVAADPAVEPSAQAENQARLTAAAARQSLLRLHEELAPRGPFISLLEHEMHCFDAAIQGVCGGRFGFGGGAFAPEPAMAGSIVSALRGGCWLVNQRPCYSVFLGVFGLLVSALFGGAICRSAAVQTARDQSISLGEALRFTRQRYGGFIAAPVVPIAVMLGIALIMFLGGLIGTVGYVGELFTGVLYGLALLGGFAAAMLALGTVLGFPLMWPTIAVEGSDGFDALSRACSYVSSRIWHCAFYAFSLLVYGALSFVLVRLVALLTLKLSHKFTGWGLNLISSAELDGIRKLDAMWRMPAWSDLSLLPAASDTPFWGTFFNGPLDGTETFSAGLIAIWVYLLVSLVCAFVVSFFFTGGVQMYFLLRRHVDATDWDEVYYEEPEEEEFPAVEPPPAEETPDQPAAPADQAPAAETEEKPSEDHGSSESGEKPDDEPGQA